MLYCTKCRRLWEDSAGKCPHCKSARLRPAGGEDMAFLLGCGLYAAGRLEEALCAARIPCQVEDTSKGHSYFTFDSEAMPTDKNVYVAYARYEEAQELAAQVGQALEAEQAAQEEQGAEPPGAKRIVGEVVSIVGFLALVMAAVYGADAFANWLKGLFGMG